MTVKSEKLKSCTNTHISIQLLSIIQNTHTFISHKSKSKKQKEQPKKKKLTSVINSKMLWLEGARARDKGYICTNG